VTAARRIISEKRALILPIVIVLLANLALFALVVYPLSRKVAGGEAAAEASAAALNQARRDHAAARATVSGKTQADEELQKFYEEVLPPDVSGARRITFLPLDQLAREMNLRIEGQNSSQKEVRDSQLMKLTTIVTLKGEYRDIRRFIHAIEKAPEFRVLENVQLSQDEGESRAINVMVQIATYFRTGANGS
jgi:Tfp pilus assembly protein PilO